MVASALSIFQSTLPLRGVTAGMVEISEVHEFQSTLPLRGVTGAGSPPIRIRFISIHTPLAGSDMAVELGVTIQVLFQSTLPLRGVTGVTFARRSFRFQSTLPLRGVTVSRFWSWIACRRFQSTLPLRGATRRRRPVPSGLAISIHTPLAGSDRNVTVFVCGLYTISIHTPLAGSDPTTREASNNR